MEFRQVAKHFVRGRLKNHSRLFLIVINLNEMKQKKRKKCVCSCKFKTKSLSNKTIFIHWMC